MAEAVAPTPSPRLPIWVMIIALVICALAGVFVLLWFKLPTWAPEWVVEHSPWADPVVRALEGGRLNDRQFTQAEQRLVLWGPSAAPALITALDTDSWRGGALAVSIFSQMQDDRAIKPLLRYLARAAHRLEGMEKGGLGFSRGGSNLSNLDRIQKALLHQRRDLLIDEMLPLFHGDDLATVMVIELSGYVADDRVVPALKELLWEEFEDGFTHQRVRAAFGGRGVMAAITLMRSPLQSAIPAMLPAFSDPSVVVRRRAVFSVQQFEGEKVDPRVGEAMRDRLSDTDGEIRRAAAKAMVFMIVPGAEIGLIGMSHRAEAKDREAVVYGLGSKQATRQGIDRLVECLKDPDEAVRWSAVRSLARTNNELAVQPLLDVMQTGTLRLRREAIYELGSRFMHREARVFSALLGAIDDPEIGVSEVAEMVLVGKRLTKEQQAAVDSAIERQNHRRPPRDQGLLSE